MNLFSDLTTKTVLITGAFGHIGRELSTNFAKYGSSLILLDTGAMRDDVFLARLAEHSRVSFVPVDFESRSSKKEAINLVIEEYPRIDVLINNAAFVGTSKLGGWTVPFEEQTVDTWNRALDVNLTTPFELIQGLIDPLRKSNSASIINISSIYGVMAPDWSIYEGTSMGNPAAYGVSKAGLIQLTKWLATYLAPEIRANCVSPGGLYRNQDPVFVEKYLAKTPLGRMATESDVVNCVSFLASEVSQYITGQNLVVDGGFTIR